MEGKELELDLSHLDDSIEFGKTIMQAILDAEREAIKQGIKTNTVILSPKFDATKKFWFSILPNSVYEYNPMILGKAVILEDMLPDDYCFALAETKANRATLEEKLKFYENFFKKYVKTDGQSLRFKGISNKKNVADFDKILSIISEGDK